jgi:tetratricopeptide (TPR) repeat protein
MPEDVQIAVALAALYEQQGLLVEARAQYLTVGDLLARRGNSREALEVLQRVADLDPNNTDIRLRLADGFAREGLTDLAAQAFTEAADRLISKSKYDSALAAYKSALELRPQGHAALQGLLTAHAALGTADEAAEVLEKVIASKPGDLELRAMLVRAYVESEDSPEAERAAEDLVARDPTSYACFFDVARLCIKRKEGGRAVALVGRITETALSGRDDAQLLEVLEEVLRRDPEHMGALLLLARIFEWQRNDARLIATLERLAEAAEAAKAEDEERRALARLVRLGRRDARVLGRLSALGGAPDLEDEGGAQQADDAAATQHVSDEVPTFESFMLPDESQARDAALQSADPPVPPDFTWETTEQPPPAVAASPETSFADIGAGFDDASAVEFGAHAGVSPAAAPQSAPPSFDDFQSVDFGAAAETTPPAEDSRERMLRQELESVDFYITQGYTDVARDTVDMLEQQFGAHPLIEERRARLAPAADINSAAPAAEPPAAPAAETLDDLDAAFAGISPEPPAANASDPARSDEAVRPANAASGVGGLDAGLAAIFDEFREAVEDVEQQETPDYEAHYNLGLAYKDIEMYDQAVEAFQQAIQAAPPGDGTPRYLQCCNMLGHCFMQKGMPKLAAMWFRKGLDARGHTEDEYQALRYELGAAFEQMGDTRRAIDTFTEVYGIDVTYRGVADKLRELQEREAVNRES